MTAKECQRCTSGYAKLATDFSYSNLCHSCEETVLFSMTLNKIAYIIKPFSTEQERDLGLEGLVKCLKRIIPK